MLVRLRKQRWDTVREPLIVLDKDLRVIAASRSFYVKFTTNPDDSQGQHLYELGDGEWNIPKASSITGKHYTGPSRDG
jgi:hypothetical protein